jgi:hypothetical protein
MRKLKWLQASDLVLFLWTGDFSVMNNDNLLFAESTQYNAYISIMHI